MSPKKAQTIIELAAFGSVLIFLIGIIIRQALSFAYIQNQALKAMRVALLTSYEYSEGIKSTGPVNPNPGKGVASRNRSSILLIEDRLSADAAKYGTIDRNPYINGGNATFSHNLFLPVDARTDTVPAPAPGFQNRRILGPTEGEPYNLPIFDLFVNGIHIPLTTTALAEISRVDPVVTGQNIQYYYTRVPNHDLESEWCDDSDLQCPCIRKPDNDNDNDEGLEEIDPETCQKFPVAFRFDLGRCNQDRANMPDCLDGTKDVVVTPDEYTNFSWQWSVIHTLDLKRGNQIDIDGDLKEENVIYIDDKNNKIIYSDSQLGDIDFTIGDQDNQIEPGLKPDVSMMTKTKDGTYLFINEGRLFDTFNQFVRTASKKESIDLIVRVFQLSNDTGRFCKSDGTIQQDSSIWTNDTPQNPVEACNDCFSPQNLDKTCMDQHPDSNNPKAPPILYLRSRVLDKHGRNWVTNESGDLYIKLQGP